MVATIHPDLRNGAVARLAGYALSQCPWSARGGYGTVSVDRWHEDWKRADELLVVIKQQEKDMAEYPIPLTEEETWITQDGRRMLVGEMTESHVRNALRWLIRKNRAPRENLLLAPGNRRIVRRPVDSPGDDFWHYHEPL